MSSNRLEHVYGSRNCVKSSMDLIYGLEPFYSIAIPNDMEHSQLSILLRFLTLLTY